MKRTSVLVLLGICFLVLSCAMAQAEELYFFLNELDLQEGTVTQIPECEFGFILPSDFSQTDGSSYDAKVAYMNAEGNHVVLFKESQYKTVDVGYAALSSMPGMKAYRCEVNNRKGAVCFSRLQDEDTWYVTMAIVDVGTEHLVEYIEISPNEPDCLLGNLVHVTLPEKIQEATGAEGKYEGIGQIRISQEYSVNVRKAPDIHSEQIGTARIGKIYTAFREIAGWFEIELEEGQRGFVSGRLSWRVDENGRHFYNLE